MNCERCQQDVYEFIDGTLSERRRRTLQRHLESCSQCRQFLARERQLHDKLAPTLAPALNRIGLSDTVRRNIFAAEEVGLGSRRTGGSNLTLGRISIAASLAAATIGAAGAVYLLKHSSEPVPDTKTAVHAEPATFIAVSETRTPLGAQRTMILQVSNGRKAYGYASATWSGGWMD